MWFASSPLAEWITTAPSGCFVSTSCILSTRVSSNRCGMNINASRAPCAPACSCWFRPGGRSAGVLHLDEVALHARGLWKRGDSHGAKHLRRLGEQNVAIPDHLDVIPPGVDEREEATGQ